MAQRTTVVLLDDLDASPADQSVEFGLDGVTYEIDLTDDHARALRDELALYIVHARRTGTATSRPHPGGTGRPTPSADVSATVAPTPRPRAAAPAAVDREQIQAVRDWATRHGHPLSPRGRIPAAVSEAFHRNDPAALAPAGAVPAPTEGAVPAGSAPDPGGRAPTADRVGPDGLTAEERERIRAWALEEGIEVKTRGRLTRDLVANYRAVAARR